MQPRRRAGGGGILTCERFSLTSEASSLTSEGFPLASKVSSLTSEVFPLASEASSLTSEEIILVCQRIPQPAEFPAQPAEFPSHPAERSFSRPGERGQLLRALN